ncbi:MAG TPA: hypothetical protein VN721_01710 [Flavipsychrobacter sp.]|nr:hypothetical protein [Flavipsychrobacter sp.]
MKVERKAEEGIFFKIRFNTAHGDTALYWRIIIDEEEYLATSLQCLAPTYSDASFDKKAGVIKYHIAGRCNEFYIDDNDNATFK